MNFNIKTRQTIISMRIGENKEQVFVVIFTKLQKVRLEKQIHLKQLNNSAKYLILSYCFSSHIKCILNRTTNDILISFNFHLISDLCRRHSLTFLDYFSFNDDQFLKFLRKVCAPIALCRSGKAVSKAVGKKNLNHLNLFRWNEHFQDFCWDIFSESHDSKEEHSKHVEHM